MSTTSDLSCDAYDRRLVSGLLRSHIAVARRHFFPTTRPPTFTCDRALRESRRRQQRRASRPRHDDDDSSSGLSGFATRELAATMAIVARNDRFVVVLERLIGRTRARSYKRAFVLAAKCSSGALRLVQRVIGCWWSNGMTAVMAFACMPSSSLTGRLRLFPTHLMFTSASFMSEGRS